MKKGFGNNVNFDLDMSEKSVYPVYCNQPKYKGATCLREDLEFIETVEDCQSETFIIKESIYKCRVCQGIYKYCLFEKDETRNLDCDPGWWTVLDRFFKIEEIY